MITYTGPRDLEQFGFDCLTGEACGLGLRLLYDVNDMGKAIVARTIGLPSVGLVLPDSWNSKFTEGSVMLTNEMAQTCALFGMLYFMKPACFEVWRTDDGRLLGFDDVEMRDGYRAFMNEHGGRIPGDMDVVGIRIFRSSRDPGTGDRNTHAMSGRTV